MKMWGGDVNSDTQTTGDNGDGRFGTGPMVRSVLHGPYADAGDDHTHALLRPQPTAVAAPGVRSSGSERGGAAGGGALTLTLTLTP